MKTFIVLFSVNHYSSRKNSELIENRSININTNIIDEYLISENIFDTITRELNLTDNEKDLTRVIPITDFMDMFNNEEINPDNYFMSYIYVNILK